MTEPRLEPRLEPRFEPLLARRYTLEIRQQMAWPWQAAWREPRGPQWGLCRNPQVTLGALYPLHGLHWSSFRFR